ncbi:amphi-Trp domain-containing protein [Halostagnicola sp. A-GB9-2]|uniref:amphi-Trp domain-containing protein n=1 Tax=Halostagnicola sp. A-GB9-2 TaxID=3048066 RepID=UPI0024BF7098|nr:amphi-Trp domain-containing protein [Halostagnicola sp. A-GB9-2]MDJ1434250.1 amphi-Trp domain-containing protein [Halostagnicola sp. A-GB9-2]
MVSSFSVGCDTRDKFTYGMSADFAFAVAKSISEAFSPQTLLVGELETEEQKTRTGISTHLRDLANQLNNGGNMLDLGGTEAQLNPTESVTFKLEGESDWSQGDTEAKQSIEFELVWRRGTTTAEEGTLDIQE